MQLQPQLTKSLDSYELRVSPMILGDAAQLHELSISVAWPHRSEDWELVIRNGHGIVARDEIERLVGSAMWFELGKSHAAVGMVITSPRMQELGTGRWLMNHIMDQIGDRGMVLNATRPAYRLYIALGFIPLSPVFQHNGEVTATPEPRAQVGLRAVDPQDRDSIIALDTAAFGLPRDKVIGDVFDISHGTVIEQAGQIAGFALCRKFGRGHVIGPVVGETEEQVIALIAPIVSGHRGSFLRMDTRVPDGPLRRFLVAHGLVHHDTVTRMVYGTPLPAPQGAARSFGLMNQAFG